MKTLAILAISFFTVSAFAFEDYSFNCDLGSFTVQSVPNSTSKAPESPVVGLNIKVLKQQVPLFLMKAKSSNGDKDLFITDWTSPTLLSEDGNNLLDLLGLFYPVDSSNIDSLRAGIPTNLLDTFAYIEIKDKQGNILKLGFDGTNPTECQ